MISGEHCHASFSISVVSKGKVVINCIRCTNYFFRDCMSCIIYRNWNWYYFRLSDKHCIQIINLISLFMATRYFCISRLKKNEMKVQKNILYSGKHVVYIYSVSFSCVMWSSKMSWNSQILICFLLFLQPFNCLFLWNKLIKLQ